MRRGKSERERKEVGWLVEFSYAAPLAKSAAPRERDYAILAVRKRFLSPRFRRVSDTSSALPFLLVEKGKPARLSRGFASPFSAGRNARSSEKCSEIVFFFSSSFRFCAIRRNTRVRVMELGVCAVCRLTLETGFLTRPEGRGIELKARCEGW